LKIPSWTIVLALSLASLAILPAKDVIVASYNLKNYLPMSRQVGGKMLPDQPKPEKEIHAALDVLSEIKPDILGVVEMGDEKVLAEFQSRLASVGLEYPYAEWVQGADESRHIALLSRFPIITRSSRSRVPVELNGRFFQMCRGILDVTLQITPTSTLRLVGLHLKSQRLVPEYDEAKFRARESIAVRAYLDSILKDAPDAGLLVFGDLNDSKNEFPVQEILGPPKSPMALRDIRLKDRWGFTWTHYWAEADIYSRFDYLLVNHSLWPKINMGRSGINSSLEWARASDHRAIFTQLSFPE
jgi:hypothetical protein